jgi:hypothetical protein
MSKLILFSMVFATMFIPALAARNRSADVGMKKAVLQTLMFDAFYAFALIYLWGRC